MKGNHSLTKSTPVQVFFLKFLMKTAPLDDNCPFAEAKHGAQLPLQPKPLGKQRGGCSGEGCNSHNTAFI